MSSLSARVSVLEQQLVERDQALAARDQVIAALQATLTALQGQIAALQATLSSFASENTLLKRKLYGAKSERRGTAELQNALGGLLDQEKALQKQLDELTRPKDKPAFPPTPPKPPATRPPPKGRRDLSVSSLPKVVVEITDPELAARGKVIGHDESCQLMYRRGGWQVLVRRTAKYEIEVAGETTVLGTEVPKLLIPRGLLHTSALAFLAVQKFALGVPHYRLEQHLETQGESLDRSVMCRGMEELGNALGATIVEAMKRDAMTCQVLSTDATGAAIQPEAHPQKLKQACKKGHFFVVVADADHVLFAYTERHTQDAVKQLFHGFRGFLQSDASSVYHLLERGPPSDAEGAVELVGCWAHARRYFFEAAVCKYAVGVEGLTRIGAIYAADDLLAKLPPSTRQREREAKVRPLMDDFFRWVHEAARSSPGRTLASKALGYARHQEEELRRVLKDGRLPLDNTRSERALRTIVVGRKNWMFYGSDVHAEAAAALFSLMASCRLHRLDAERYLEEVARVLPYWPRERMLELSPKHWQATRAKLSSTELEAPAGAITVPA